MNFLVAAVAAAAVGLGANSPVSSVGTIGSVEWGAVHALSHLMDMPGADQYEYSGIISLHNGVVTWTAFPHTDHIRDGVRVWASKQLLPGDTLLGLYHNHPCMPRTHYNSLLSQPDVMTTYVFGVPQFMLDECTGDVHAYDPARDHVLDTAVPVRMYDQNCNPVNGLLPRGRIIGNIGRKYPDIDPVVLPPHVNDCQ